MTNCCVFLNVKKKKGGKKNSEPISFSKVEERSSSWSVSFVLFLLLVFFASVFKLFCKWTSSCVRRLLCPSQRLPGTGWSLCSINPKSVPKLPVPWDHLSVFQSHKTVCLLKVNTGVTFFAVYRWCWAIYCSKLGRLMMWWQLGACVF